MDLTIVRWLGGLAVACGLAAVTLFRLPPAPPATWMRADSPALAAAVERVSVTGRELTAAVRRYRTAQAVVRWRAAGSRGDTLRLRLDASVPPALAAGVREVAAQQWARLGPGASAAGAEVFVYVDTSSIARPDAPAGRRRPLESRLALDLWHALPEATDGRRCVALVRLRSTSPDVVERLRAAPLLGPCGFYAAFGAPGAGVRAWLAATGYGVARRSDWDVPRAQAVDAAARYDLPTPATHCLTGDARRCATGLHLAAGVAPRNGHDARPGVRGRADRFDELVLAAGQERGALLGREEGRLLADLVREIGRERFARFWHSASTPQQAFADATGDELTGWVGAWATRTYGAPTDRPTPRARDVVWLAVGIPLMLAVAVRRRERVLGERLFGLGAAR